MKKVIVVFLALFVPTTLWAMDIPQGKLELAGRTAINFSDSSTEVSGSQDIDTTSFNLQFDGLYYLRNNLGVGLVLEYEKSEVEQGSVSVDSSMLLLGPQASYNFPLNEKISLFVNGAVGYVTMEVENNDADGFGFVLGGGLKYFLTNAVSINGTLQYQNMSLEDDAGNDMDTSGFNIGAGLSLYF